MSTPFTYPSGFEHTFRAQQRVETQFFRDFRQLREAARLTVDELASRSGAHPDLLREVEAGKPPKREPDPLMAAVIVMCRESQAQR